MKKRALLYLVCSMLTLLCSQTANAQHYEASKKRVYHVTVYNGESETDGILYETTDTSIVILTSEEYRKFKSRKMYNLTNIPYTRIDVIKIARTNKFLRCLAYGAAAGIVAGVIYAITTNDKPHGLNPPSDSERITYGALAGGGIGAFTGFFFGLAKMGIHIEKDKAKFQENKEKLDKRVLGA